MNGSDRHPQRAVQGLVWRPRSVERQRPAMSAAVAGIISRDSIHQVALRLREGLVAHGGSFHHET